MYRRLDKRDYLYVHMENGGIDECDASTVYLEQSKRHRGELGNTIIQYSLLLVCRLQVLVEA
jgi:hypothetical protein